MDSKLPFVSYTLATLSGVCFIGGLVILSTEGRPTIWSDLKKSCQHWSIR